MNKTSKIALLALAGICVSNSGRAAGWQLSDYSMAGLGRAYAGGGVVGDDYSALAYNPAGMTLSGSGMQVGIAGIHEHADVSAPNYAGRDASTNLDVTVAVPNFFTQYKLNDKVVIGAGVYVPFGLATQYDKDWEASDHGIKSSLQAIDYTIGAGIKVTDKLSLGLAAFARDAKVYLTSTAGNGAGRNKFDLEDWSVGTRVGVMYELDENTRFGVSYTSRTREEIKGESYLLSGMRGIMDTKLITDAPEYVQLGAYHKLNSKVALSAGAKWTRWTRFKALTIRPVSEVAQRWENAWTVSVGADYFYSEKLTLRAGIGFDESPVPNSRLRTAAIADNDRWELSLGASYKASDKTTFDVGYMFLYLPTYTVHNNRADLNGRPGVATPLHAKYRTTAHVLGFQVQYSF